jgi:hypothetical protein
VADAHRPYKPLAPNLFPATHVYFITDGRAIKIGRSGMPWERMKDIQTNHVTRLEMIGHFRADPDEELRLHNRFNHLRLKGEWFKPAPDLIAILEQLDRDGILESYCPRHIPKIEEEAMADLPISQALSNWAERQPQAVRVHTRLLVANLELLEEQDDPALRRFVADRVDELAAMVGP